MASDLTLSIITPVFNRRESVAESVHSSLRFLRETGVEGEILVVDDGSSDGSAQNIKEAYPSDLAAAAVRVFRLNKNMGVTAARQHAVENASGRWLIMMDSDDTFRCGAGKAVISVLRAASAKCPIIFFRCCERETGKLVGPSIGEAMNLTVSGLLRGGLPGECLPAVRREALLAHPYTADLRGFEILTYARIARARGPVCLSPLVVRNYSVCGERLSARRSVRRRGCLLAKGYWILLREFWQYLGLALAPLLARLMYHFANCVAFAAYSKLRAVANAVRATR